MLARGYSITYGPAGVVMHADQVAAGDEVRIGLVDGNVYATVGTVERHEGADGSVQ